jgi:hypothetical protein
MCWTEQAESRPERERAPGKCAGTVCGAHIYWLLDFDAIFETFVACCKATGAAPAANEFFRANYTLWQRSTQSLSPHVAQARANAVLSVSAKAWLAQL